MSEYIDLPKWGKDIAGQRFGRLVALGPVDFRRPGGVFWLCQCDCGQTAVVRTRNLGYGTARSCGCLYREGAKTRARTHGKSGTPLYRVWQSMNGRCHSPGNTNYKDYGGRGISVCAEWRNSFEDFEFYVAQLPRFDEDGYTLDRINNDGNYEPGNVKWSTQSEQLRNTRRTRFLTHDGRTQCLSDWSNELGIRKGTLLTRLRLGWSVEDALTAPVRDRGW